MKKVACFVLLLFLCGCATQKNVCPVITGTGFTVVADYCGEEFSCAATVDDSGQMQLTVLKPEDLSGLKLIHNAEGITAEYLGISYTPDKDHLVAGSVSGILYQVLVDASRKGRTAVCEDGNFLLQGSTDSGDYQLTLAPTGLPLKLEISDACFTAEFLDVKIMN